MQQTLDLPNPDAWLDVEQTLARLGCARQTLYNMLADGRVTGYRIGSVRVFWKREIEELAAALKRVKVPGA